MKSIHDARYQQLISKLVRVRGDRGVTQVQLASLLNKPQSYIAKVENLERRLDVVELRDWLKQLEVDPTDFLFELSWWEQSK